MIRLFHSWLWELQGNLTKFAQYCSLDGAGRSRLEATSYGCNATPGSFTISDFIHDG